MQDHQDKIVAALMEQLIETGPESMAQTFTALFNLAMRTERDQHVGAGLHERSEERRGYANGYKSKTVDTPAGSLALRVPKSRGCEEPFFPQSLERGRRSSRAIMLAIAQMYVQGVSTRDAAKVMAEFGLESLSSTQVSRAAALLDKELEEWRTRTLGQVRYLVLDARYEKVRDGGVVRDAAILSAVGVDPEGRRRLLGVSVALSEAEVHWRGFLDSLIARGMRGVEFVVSDDHAGLRAARQAVLPGAKWQRCQFHLAQDAIHHAPNLAIRKRIGGELRAVWNAHDTHAAQAELGRLVEGYAETAPKLAAWLETNVPEGLTVFALSEHHRRRMRTSNPIERAVQQEIKRRTRKVRVFPNEDSLLRLVTAVLAEIDEDWATTDRVYINMDDRNG
jgi:putative transposase